MMLLVSLLLSLVFLLLLPQCAYAWGPATHLQLGVEILKNAFVLEKGLQRVLLEFPYAYLYGCIAADIIFAKGLARVNEHSHCWRVGLGILDGASSACQQALAYGYLSHLAADIVAHNYFIPERIIETYRARTLRHLYWEVRFDTCIKAEFWSLATEIASSSELEHDALLEKMVKRTLFSFKTDKKIFNGLLVLNRTTQWQQMLASLSKKSVWKLPASHVDRFLRASLMASFDFLLYHSRGWSFRQDPTGRAALSSAKKTRKMLRQLSRQGRLTPAIFVQTLNAFHHHMSLNTLSVPFVNARQVRFDAP